MKKQVWQYRNFHQRDHIILQLHMKKHRNFHQRNNIFQLHMDRNTREILISILQRKINQA
jgi:hypothetical protein